MPLGVKILFVHQNFPAQFRLLAPTLAQHGHDVTALAVDTNKQRSAGVRTVGYQLEPGQFQAATFRMAASFAEEAHRGEVVARVAGELRRILQPGAAG